MSEAMTYDALGRADPGDCAPTVGKSPGVAGVQIERQADVFCPTCARDILGSDLFERVKHDNPGYDHDRSDDLGNITAVLSSTEADCPGLSCGHCGIPLDVRTIHYPGVCQPDYCPLSTECAMCGDCLAPDDPAADTTGGIVCRDCAKRGGVDVGAFCRPTRDLLQ